MTYLWEPFLESPNSPELRKHSNYYHSTVIADSLAKRGYTVDATSWRNPEPPDGRDYDLIVGLGPAFTAAAARRRQGARAIYLGTGAAPEVTNKGLLQRRGEFRHRHGVVVAEALLDPDRGPEVADLLAVIGDDWVGSTYRSVSKAPIIYCPNSVIEGVVDTRTRKDFAESRKHFLWIAAYGPLRRKLDLVLEAFARMPDVDLWVCGGAKYDKQFAMATDSWLNGTRNIHHVGWVDVTSSRFQEVTAKCGFLLYPSVSDGMPGSVINSMASGLVPLVTKEAGVDVGGFGRVVKMDSVDDVVALVRWASEMSPTELEARAERASEVARVDYDPRMFGCQFDRALSVVCGDAVATQANISG